jgi:maleylpyruvate isomerase
MPPARARLILGDARAATDRIEDVWRRMPPDAWSRPAAARAGVRPAWMSVWARWRESEIHHVDLDVGFTHRHWPVEFVGLLLPWVLPTLPARLDGQAAVRVEATDREPPVAAHLAAMGLSATTGGRVT